MDGLNAREVRAGAASAIVAESAAIPPHLRSRVFDQRLLRLAEHYHGIILDTHKTMNRIPAFKARGIGVGFTIGHQEHGIAGNVSIRT